MKKNKERGDKNTEEVNLYRMKWGEKCDNSRTRKTENGKRYNKEGLKGKMVHGIMDKRIKE